MCPVCLATAVLTVTSASPAGGLTAFFIHRFRHRFRKIFLFRMRENIRTTN
jgi:hypothetical protein